MPPATLLDALSPLFTLDPASLADPAEAEAEVARRLPPAAWEALRAQVEAGGAEGWLTPRQAPDGVRFGRLAKPSAATHSWSVDAVLMDGAGRAHLHPLGEISLCFALEGDPTFCGRPPGVVVVPPGSRHVPEVQGGRMAILYLLPEGAMVFDP